MRVLPWRHELAPSVCIVIGEGEQDAYANLVVVSVIRRASVHIVGRGQRNGTRFVILVLRKRPGKGACVSVW